jgi:hypothetical protein
METFYDLIDYAYYNLNEAVDNIPKLKDYTAEVYISDKLYSILEDLDEIENMLDSEEIED